MFRENETESKIKTGTLNRVSVFLFSSPIQLLFMLCMLFSFAVIRTSCVIRASHVNSNTN